MRHDDDPPMGYHAFEVWSVSADGGRFRAAISDPRSGMRWFSSVGWRGETLTWIGPAESAPREQFAYTLKTDGQLQIDWSVAREPDQPMRLGDTLLCRKVDPSL